MAKPYSVDLREHAVAAVLRGGLSCHETAGRFGLAVSTVIKWVRRFRETGSVAPLKNPESAERRGILAPTQVS